MKVCLLNDSFPPLIDGVANTVVNYANILTEEHLADVIVGTPRYKEGQYDQYPYSIVDYPSSSFGNIIDGYRIGNPLSIHSIDRLANFQPDIIHSHCPASSTILARILRQSTKAPIVFTYHTKFDYDLAQSIRSKIVVKETLHAIVMNISACDEIWVVSKGAGENLRSLGYEGDYRIMTNGVDFEKGRVSQELVSRITKDYDLPLGVPVFLFVGRIMKYKGIPLIIDAMKLLSERGMDFRMVFIGGGSDVEELQAQVSEYGLSKQIIFTGPIHDREAIRAWNTRANLFLFPSVYDTNGLVVREAAACGLASVLIKDSCASEGITDGRNGFVIEESAEAMAALLSEVCKDLDHLSEVGLSAMNEIYVSWSTSVREAHNRYEEILELKKSGRLPAKAMPTTENFLKLVSNIMDNFDHMFSPNRNLFEDLEENISVRNDYMNSDMKHLILASNVEKYK